MQFSEIPGADRAKERLISSFFARKYGHAQLFIGADGGVQLPLALSYALLLLCENPNTYGACGTCKSCKMSFKYSHPDLHFIFPVAKSSKSGDKPDSDSLIGPWREAISKNPFLTYISWLMALGVENKQALIAAHESENLLKKIGLKSYTGGKKVFLVWLPEKMNTSSANKLLKVIEEPTDNTVLIFVSSNEEGVLPTIKSRTQKLLVPRNSDAEIETFLIARGVEEGRANLAAMSAEGSVGIALDAVESNELMQEYADLFARWMRAVFSVKLDQLVVLSETMAAFYREKLKDYFKFISQIFKKALHYNLGIDKNPPAIFSQTGFRFDGFAKFITHENINDFQEYLDKAAKDIERNASSKIVLLDLSLQFSRVFQSMRG